eukprot:TRINITY_DN6586_c0_g1_i1.p1 TRINITY_DN6586_c0_g1~~TRINITY_DN6586_c0_g1_i1.p1  ORF type:complete len:100 (+),score=7.74 TRINITY_DN6586_c0_g1_i1:105-404(+)
MSQYIKNLPDRWRKRLPHARGGAIQCLKEFEALLSCMDRQPGKLPGTISAQCQPFQLAVDNCIYAARNNPPDVKNTYGFQTYLMRIRKGINRNIKSFPK